MIIPRLVPAKNKRTRMRNAIKINLRTVCVIEEMSVDSACESLVDNNAIKNIGHIR